MYQNKTVSIVLPCLNEQEGLKKLIPLLPDCIDEIVVSDNNSTDDTKAVAASLGAKVVVEPKKGYGAAYKKGLQAATGDIIVTMDGDCTYPPDEIGPCLDYLLDNDLQFVSAARFPLKNSDAMDLTNIIGNKILTGVSQLLFRCKFKDSQSGMWVFYRDVLRKISVTNDGMPFSEEIKIKAVLHPAVDFDEKNIHYQPRVGEVKLNRWRDGFRNLAFLIKLRFSVMGQGRFVSK